MVRKFGKIVVKPSKKSPKYIEASYPTPVEAYGKWPGLPARQTATFPLTQEGRDDAATWLNRARKRIEADVWEPERLLKRKERDKAMTFAQFVEQWCREREQSGLIRASTLRLSDIGARPLLEAFGPMPITRITGDDIERFAATVYPENPSSRYMVLRTLKQILTAAAKPDSVGHSVIPRSPYTMPLPPRPHRDETPPATPEQLYAIHDAMPELQRLAITLTVNAGGLRIGEVCALKRRDIDLERRTISIRRTRLDDVREPTGLPKTAASIRTETIPEAIIPEIKAHLDRYVASDGDAWIFPAPRSRDNTEPMPTSTLRFNFRRARKTIGREDLRFHDLRSTALTLLAQNGATVRELMAAAGHSTPAMAIHYQRATETRQRALADRVAATLIPHTQPQLEPDERDRRIAELEAQIERLKALASD